MPPRPELQAAALGLIQGAAELLPVSSSAHVAALPWLLGWELVDWPPERRKELEVALHLGAAVALAPALWRALPDARTLALSLAPAVLVGYALERPIERRLGGPGALAAGLLAGAAALAAADRVPAGASRAVPPAPHREPLPAWTRRAMPPGRRRGAARLPAAALRLLPPAWRGRDAPLPARDALALGLAQAAALVPGVSRTGATLAAARALGYSRGDASRLSFAVAGPVLAGATALKALRAAQRHAPADERRVAGIGAACAGAATAAALRVLGAERRAPLWPWAAERSALALAILAVRYRRAP